MSKINHSRPYLKFIDNLKREKSRTHTGAQSANLKGALSKKLKYAYRLDTISLDDRYWDKINELLSSSSRFFELEGGYAESFVSGSAKKRNKILAEKADVEMRMVNEAKALFALEFIAIIQGQSSNLQKFINTFKFVLEKNDCIELWELLTLNIFPKALASLEEVLGSDSS